MLWVVEVMIMLLEGPIHQSLDRWHGSYLAFCRDGSLLDPFGCNGLDDSLHVTARGVDEVGVQGAQGDEFIYFGDGVACRGCHHGVEVAGGFSVHEVAEGVGL